MCPGSSGPGSMTRVGPVPTTQVFVPSSVNGPGLGARTQTMPSIGHHDGSEGSSLPMGDTTADGRAVAELLRARIARQGPITFAAFMDAALYGEGGFYGRRAVGERGDFVTAPHVSPVFGILLAAQVEEFWRLLDEPDPFSIVEAGAGDGTLARQVMDALPDAVRRRSTYLAVDRSPTARAALRAEGLRAAASVSELPAARHGCLLANELLDNLPFHRLRMTDDGPAELYVRVDGDGFELVQGPLSEPGLADLVPAELSVGLEWPARPAATRFLDEAIRAIARGYVWLADYALSGAEEAPSVHGYRAHRLETDVLSEPGSRDITAGVDFASLARHASGRGLAVWGPVSQRDALLALGFRDLDRRAQQRQVEAVAARRGIDALRIYSNRARANLLLARGGLGDFSVMCVGIGVEREPASTSSTL
ncbi:MAG: hypothetical protein E6G44_05325 [Actinobacteria bacterium]|nr:MAG: hypothetical protein E6G44_05325 [Actinomycetota bacterium]